MAVTLSTPAIPRQDRYFYRGMSLIIAAIVFAGFSRTFYLSHWMAAPALSPVRLVHGLAFTGWVLLFLVQTTLVAAGRTDLHRRLGVAGAVLAVVMVVLGTLLALEMAREGRGPPGIPPLAFLAIPLFDMLVFAPLVALAIWYRRRPQIHKRLMLLATLSLLAAAVARIRSPLAMFGPLYYFGVVDLLVLLAVLYDAATRRRVHPVYRWGGLALVASQVLRVSLSGTEAWSRFAAWLVG